MQHLPHRKEDEVVATTKLRRRTAHTEKKSRGRQFLRCVKSCFTMCWGSGSSSRSAQDKQEAWERRKLMDDYDSDIDSDEEYGEAEDERLMGPENKQRKQAPRSFVGSYGLGKN